MTYLPIKVRIDVPNSWSLPKRASMCLEVWWGAAAAAAVAAGTYQQLPAKNVTGKELFECSRSDNVWAEIPIVICDPLSRPDLLNKNSDSAKIYICAAAFSCVVFRPLVHIKRHTFRPFCFPNRHLLRILALRSAS
jgi:hypothetical protein